MKTMKLLGTLNLLILLFGLAACGGNAAPTATAILVAQDPTAAPTATATVAVAEKPGPTPTATPTKVAPEPSATPTEATPEPTAPPATKPGYFSREELIEDARQLADAIEIAHPDPYIRGGGKIAFHRRLHRLLNAIPAGGMTRVEFTRLLRPFIAAVGDSHTDIWDDYPVNNHAPGGVPLRFDIVEQSLYVAGVPPGVDRDLIGATLVSVEGVPLAQLVERQKQIQGTENEYNVLQILADLSLWYRPFMEDLLPEWQDTSSVSVELQLTDGEVQKLAFDLPKSMDAMFTPGSRVALPSTDDSGFLYDFLDAEKKIAYLRIDHLVGYREHHEAQAAAGAESSTEQTRARIPSATETFRDMVVDMKGAGTDTLIIDLRDNQGGDSLMGDILTYFLYGKQTLQRIQMNASATGGGLVRMYSSLYFENLPNRSIDDFNEGRAVPLIVGDYDFSLDFKDDVERFLEGQSQAIAYVEETWLGRTATFFQEYQSETYSGYYLPRKVLVLVNTRTFSSGFTMSKYLYLAGATLVGAPSGQAANSFGNGQLWRLDHTGILGTISSSYSVEFPDDSELARVLPVHYPLTYEKLAFYDFDPNAEYLYALELLPEPGK